jgi:hypothetical protein
MIICMRTTLVFDDDLFREARRRAAESGQTLSDLVAAALRQAFASTPLPAREPFHMPTYGGRSKRRGHEPADFAAALDDDDRGRLGR